MNTIDKVKQWFIDRDLENGGRLDKQSLKLSEEFGELCAGYLKKNEELTKDSIGDCAVVIVGLALLVKEDVQEIFDDSIIILKEDVPDYFKDLNKYISSFQTFYSWEETSMSKMYLSFAVDSLKTISIALGYDFEECFELAYQEIKDRKGRWIDGSFVKEEDLHDAEI